MAYDNKAFPSIHRDRCQPSSSVFDVCQYETWYIARSFFFFMNESCVSNISQYVIVNIFGTFVTADVEIQTNPLNMYVQCAVCTAQLQVARAQEKLLLSADDVMCENHNFTWFSVWRRAHNTFSNGTNDMKVLSTKNVDLKRDWGDRQTQIWEFHSKMHRKSEKDYIQRIICDLRHTEKAYRQNAARLKLPRSFA